jgi:hypothetical protein
MCSRVGMCCGTPQMTECWIIVPPRPCVGAPSSAGRSAPPPSTGCIQHRCCCRRLDQGGGGVAIFLLHARLAPRLRAGQRADRNAEAWGAVQPAGVDELRTPRGACGAAGCSCWHHVQLAEHRIPLCFALRNSTLVSIKVASRQPMDGLTSICTATPPLHLATPAPAIGEGTAWDAPRSERCTSPSSFRRAERCGCLVARALMSPEPPALRWQRSLPPWGLYPRCGVLDRAEALQGFACSPCCLAACEVNSS